MFPKNQNSGNGHIPGVCRFGSAAISPQLSFIMQRTEEFFFDPVLREV